MNFSKGAGFYALAAAFSIAAVASGVHYGSKIVDIAQGAVLDVSKHNMPDAHVIRLHARP